VVSILSCRMETSGGFNERSVEQRATSGDYDGTPAIARDADFGIRWAAWLARGRAHDRRVRRRLLVSAGLLVLAAALVYGFVRS